LCCQVRPLGHRRRATAYAFHRNLPLVPSTGNPKKPHHALRRDRTLARHLAAFYRTA
jgi:hypothetical protein